VANKRVVRGRHAANFMQQIQMLHATENKEYSFGRVANKCVVRDRHAANVMQATENKLYSFWACGE